VLSEEHGLRVMRKISGPDRGEKITGEWRKQHKEFNETYQHTYSKQQQSPS
jgi:hypothetical protein